MAGRIFINYRRGDDPGHTQALFQRLESAFGRDRLFMDVQGYIDRGEDFVRAIKTQVAACDVMLAVIGPQWLSIKDGGGLRRLDDPDDFVRLEIVSALDHGKRVIPVLVNNAVMPSAKDLPDALKPLAYRNATRLTLERFAADCIDLIKDLGQVSQLDPPVNTLAPDLVSGPPAPVPIIAASSRSGFWQRLFGRSGKEDKNLAAGRVLYAQARWQEAYDAFCQVIAADPESGAAYQRRAEALAQLGRWHDCLEDCKRAHERAAANDTAALMLGAAALLNLTQWNEAAAWYAAAIARDERLAAAYAWRAYAFVQAKSWQPALADADKALRLNRDLPEPHWLRGYILVGLDQSEAAIAWLNTAIQRFPEQALAYYTRAFAHAHLSAWPEAEKDCLRAIGLSPELPDSHWLCGFSQLQRVTPNIDAAVGELRTAVGLKPDFEQAIHALLWALTQRANWLDVLEESDNVLAQGIAWGQAREPNRDPKAIAREMADIIFSPRVRTVRAEAYRVLRRWDDCLAECGEALSQSPKLLDALRIRGLAHLQKKNLPDAVQDFSRVLSIDGQDAPALCWRGGANRIRHDYVAALADLDMAIALQPKLAIAYYNRGWTHLAVADTLNAPEPALEKAHADFSRLVQEAKKSGEGHVGLAEVARRRKQSDLALNHLAKARAIEPDLAQADLIHGWVHCDRKDWASAAASFAGVLRREAENAYAHFGLGECARMQRQWADALAHYGDALSHDPQLLAAYTRRAAIHVTLLDFPAAIGDYDGAIQIAGDLGLHEALAECRAGRAWAHFEVGNDGLALADIQAAADLAPKSAYVANHWGNMLGFMGAWPEALEKFERALALDELSPDNWYGSALANGYMRSFTRAIAEADKTIALGGKDSSRLNLRAWINNRRGAWAEAEPDSDEACALEPGHDFAHSNRAYARFRLGARGPARADLDRLVLIALGERRHGEPRISRMATYAWRATGEGWGQAVEETPEDPLAHYGRAVVHWLAGDFEEARSEAAAALSKGLDSAGPYDFKKVFCL